MTKFSIFSPPGGHQKPRARLRSGRLQCVSSVSQDDKTESMWEDHREPSVACPMLGDYRNGGRAHWKPVGRISTGAAISTRLLLKMADLQLHTQQSQSSNRLYNGEKTFWYSSSGAAWYIAGDWYVAYCCGLLTSPTSFLEIM